MSGSTHDAIIGAADALFYTMGFEHTSFADIAGRVGISRGNFYHHFKTKDAILDAVIARRLSQTATMLDGWAAEGGDPAGRIKRFVDILVRNQTKIMAYGCPVGTLCAELAKTGHPAQGEAARLFTLFRTWLRAEFHRLDPGADADERAMHLLGRSQGVASMANALRDPAFVATEVALMHAYVDACATPSRPDPHDLRKH
ncbi:MAG: TetR/AcrR family transcriptional regulator [Acuticoccus sp.]